MLGVRACHRKVEWLNCPTHATCHRQKNYQAVIPQRVREEVGVAIRNLLEAKAENGRIVFDPKSIVDRGIAESIAEFKADRAKGPFRTHKEFIASLHKESKLLHRKKTKRLRELEQSAGNNPRFSTPN